MFHFFFVATERVTLFRHRRCINQFRRERRDNEIKGPTFHHSIKEIVNAVLRFFQEIDIFADVANLDKGPCNLIMIPEQSRQPMMVFPAIDSRGVKRKIKAPPHFSCNKIIQAEVFLSLFSIKSEIHCEFLFHPRYSLRVFFCNVPNFVIGWKVRLFQPWLL